MDKFIDCIGLKCPLPILKTRLALNHFHKDDIVTVIADDPGFIGDIRVFCFQADLEIISDEIVNTHHKFTLRLKK